MMVNMCRRLVSPIKANVYDGYRRCDWFNGSGRDKFKYCKDIIET